MFVVKDIEEFDWPVTVRFPVDGGGFETGSFTARLRIADDATTEALESGAMGDREFLRKIWVGWSGIGDDDGNPVAFREDRRDGLLAKPYFRASLLDSYFEAVSGGRHKAKN